MTEARVIVLEKIKSLINNDSVPIAKDASSTYFCPT